MSKLLFIGLVWPEPTSSAAGWRILQLVKLLLQKYEVHFASSASKSAYSHDLNSLGVVEHQIILNDSSFDAFITELNPSVVIFDRFMIEEQYSWRVAECVPNAIRILDTEDLHFLRYARQQSYKTGKPIDYFTDLAKRELASILRCDLSLVISSFEIDLLVDKFGINKEILFFLPFQEEKLPNQINRKHFIERKHFVFIGNFIHDPNWRTVELLKRQIWPDLRKQIPNAELHIYGAYASEKVNQLHNPKERFFIMGRATDARKTLENYRVLIAPIPFGAGAKGKFVDSMYAGTPSVTTIVGAENMTLDDEWSGYIEDVNTRFVDKAVLLYSEEEQWGRFQNIGYKIFNETVGDTVYSEQLLGWIERSLLNIREMRNNNFIGQILQTQQFNASKYMSMWIEAKNKSMK